MSFITKLKFAIVKVITGIKHFQMCCSRKIVLLRKFPSASRQASVDYFPITAWHVPFLTFNTISNLQHAKGLINGQK